MTQGEAIVQIGNIRKEILRQRRRMDNHCYEVEALTAEPYPKNQTAEYEVMVTLAPVGENIKKEKVWLQVFLSNPRCH